MKEMNGIVVLLTGLFLLRFAVPVPASSPSILFRVVAPPDAKGTVVQPYVAPLLNLKSLDKVTLKPGDVLACVQRETTVKFGDHQDSFVAFTCTRRSDGLELAFTLDGLHFDTENK